MKLFKEIARCLEMGEPIVLVTVTRSEGSSPRTMGARMLVYRDGSILGTIGGGTVEHRVIEQAMAALKTGESALYRVHLTRELGMCCGGAMEFLLEPLLQDPTLVIFGAGHVGRDLCRVATIAGFKVIVVDEREEYATRERFPDAAELIVDDPLAALDSLQFGPNLYLLIVTHLHRLDEDLLRALASRTYKYLGMIGSRAKVARFLDRLRARGIADEVLARVNMPVGFAIEAVTPAEIAISIAAELINVRRNPAAREGTVPALNWRPRAAHDESSPSATVATRAGAAESQPTEPPSNRGESDGGLSDRDCRR